MKITLLHGFSRRKLQDKNIWFGFWFLPVSGPVVCLSCKFILLKMFTSCRKFGWNKIKSNCRNLSTIAQMPRAEMHQDQLQLTTIAQMIWENLFGSHSYFGLGSKSHLSVSHIRKRNCWFRVTSKKKPGRSITFSQCSAGIPLGRIYI